MMQAGRFRVVARTTAFAMVTPFLLLGTLDVRLNLTPSLPIGLYRATDDPAAPLVEFCPAEPFASLAIERGYRDAGDCPDGATALMKPVVAKEGDLVRVTDRGVEVNGSMLHGSKPRATDTKGRPMNAWPAGLYRAANDELWVISSYSDRSFDSRYFGPISTAQVRRRSQPLLVWR